MLNIAYIRANKDEVRQGCINKQLDPKVVDDLLAVDEQRRKLLIQIEQLRAEANKNVETIKQTIKTDGKPSSEQIEIGKQIKAQLKELEPKLLELETAFKEAQLYIPNIPANDVPIGTDESGNIVIRKWSPTDEKRVNLNQGSKNSRRLTGLLDKNGKKIRGGDMIECEYWGTTKTEKIVWKFNSWRLFDKDNNTYTHILLPSYKMKIVGNK